MEQPKPNDPDAKLIESLKKSSDFQHWFLTTFAEHGLLVETGAACAFIGITRTALCHEINNGNMKVFSYQLSDTRKTEFRFVRISDCLEWYKKRKERISK